jgi:hypothetical protein
VSAATIWRTCPSCGGSFEQPDDPGRRRVYCSRACQQAAYRARQRQDTGHSSGQQRTGRQDQRQDRREDWRSDRHEQRHRGAGSDRPGAGQRQQGRQDWRHEQRRQHRPPPGGANGHRPGATTDDLARIRRIIAALLPRPPRPPSPTRPPPAAPRPRPCAQSTAASTDEPTVTPRPDQPRAGRVLLGSSQPPPVPSATDRHGSTYRDGRIITFPLALGRTDRHGLAERDGRIITFGLAASRTDRHGLSLQ